MRYQTSADKGAMGLKLDRDTNGNKTIRVRFHSSGHGFTVQTNGNLPETHRMTPDSFNYNVAAAELKEHISRYGTLRQRDITGWTLFKAA